MEGMELELKQAEGASSPEDARMEADSPEDSPFKEKEVNPKSARRDSSGSTGYSTCSSELSPSSRRNASPVSPPHSKAVHEMEKDFALPLESSDPDRTSEDHSEMEKTINLQETIIEESDDHEDRASIQRDSLSSSRKPSLSGKLDSESVVKDLALNLKDLGKDDLEPMKVKNMATAENGQSVEEAERPRTEENNTRKLPEERHKLQQSNVKGGHILSKKYSPVSESSDDDEEVIRPSALSRPSKLTGSQNSLFEDGRSHSARQLRQVNGGGQSRLGLAGTVGQTHYRRGSNGYHSEESAKRRLVTPNSLTEAVALVIDGLESNINNLKKDQTAVVEQLRSENAEQFATLCRDQEAAIMMISDNIKATEAETIRIKREAEANVNGLKVEAKEDLTRNLDSMNRENKSAVSLLLENLERAKRDNDSILDRHNRAIEQLKKTQEEKFNQLKDELERVKELNAIIQSDAKDREEVRLEINNSIGKRIEHQDTTIQEIQNSIKVMADDYDDRHSDLKRYTSKSLTDLREEVTSQVLVVKELSGSIQDEFNDKLEILNQIITNEKTTNKVKLEELREALDGISVDMEEKINQATSALVQQMNSKTRPTKIDLDQNSFEREMSTVKLMLDSLSKRVGDMDDKLYDFEEKKRNNLLFYGITEFEGETKEELLKQVQLILKDTIQIKRDIQIVGVSRADTGPSISGSRPLVVTFQSFGDRNYVLARATKNQVQVTEDMSRSVRESRNHLSRFMRQVKKYNPSAVCFLQYDKLYVDNRMFYWNDEICKVVEATGESPRHRPESRSQLQSSCGSRPQSSLSRSNSVIGLQFRPQSTRASRSSSVEAGRRAPLSRKASREHLLDPGLGGDGAGDLRRHGSQQELTGKKDPVRFLPALKPARMGLVSNSKEEARKKRKSWQKEGSTKVC